MRYRQAAGELLDALERDPQVKIVLITEELYQQALVLQSPGQRMGPDRLRIVYRDEGARINRRVDN